MWQPYKDEKGKNNTENLMIYVCMHRIIVFPAQGMQHIIQKVKDNTEV